MLLNILTGIVCHCLAITSHQWPSPELREKRVMATIWSGKKKTGTRLADRSGSSLTAALLWPPVSGCIQRWPKMVTPPFDSLDRLATTADFLSDGRNLLDLNPLSAGSEERKQLSGRMRLLHWASPHHSCTLHTSLKEIKYFCCSLIFLLSFIWLLQQS